MRKISIALLTFAAFSLSTAFGQRTTSSISGTVTDASGAAVPGVLVRVTSVSTGTTAQATSNGTGFYIISNLLPDEYRMRAEKAGFQSFAQEGVLVQVNRPVTVNVGLQLGASTQTITVSGEADQLNLRSQTVSYAVTPEVAKELPLNRGDILQLVSLAPDAGAT